MRVSFALMMMMRARNKKVWGDAFAWEFRSFYVCTCIVKHVPLSLPMKPDRAGLPCNLQRAMQWPCPIVLFAEGSVCH